MTDTEFAALTRDLDSSADKSEELTMPDFEYVLSAALEGMQGHPAYNKLAEVVKRHGFRNAEQWTQAGDRIFHAWMALEMDTQGAWPIGKIKALARKPAQHNQHVPLNKRL